MKILHIHFEKENYNQPITDNVNDNQIDNYVKLNSNLYKLIFPMNIEIVLITFMIIFLDEYPS